MIPNNEASMHHQATRNAKTFLSFSELLLSLTEYDSARVLENLLRSSEMNGKHWQRAS
jgi:hypothetical protein